MIRQIGRRNLFVMGALVLWALGEGSWFFVRQLYLTQLGATPAQIGVALALEAAARALLPIPAGYLMDRIGPQKMMVFGWGIAVFAIILMALVKTWQGVVFGIVLYGLTSFVVPAITSYVVLAIPDRNVPGIVERTMTLVFAAYPVGLLISPALGGLIIDGYGFRTVLWVAVGFSALSTFTIMFAGPVALEPKEQDDSPMGLARNGLFRVVMFYYLIVQATLFTAFQLMPTFLENVRGFPIKVIGLFSSIFSIGTITANLLVGRTTVHRGFLGVASAYWLSLMILWQTDTVLAAGIAYLMLGVLFAVRTLIVIHVTQIVRPSNRGLAFGVVEVMISLSGGSAAWAAGGLYGVTPSHDLPIIVGLVGIPLLMLIWFAIPTQIKEQPTPV